MLRCFGPAASAVMNGRLISVSRVDQSSNFAFSAAPQDAEWPAVGANVDPLVLPELRHQPVDDSLVDIISAQVRVAVCGDDLQDIFADLEDRDVECAAAKIEDGDLLVFFLVQAVGHRSRGRLVDDALHIEPGDVAGVLRCLPLAVVEVRRDGDDRLGDFSPRYASAALLSFLKIMGRNFGRRV